jgi:hypothetical protein
MVVSKLTPVLTRKGIHVCILEIKFVVSDEKNTAAADVAEQTSQKMYSLVRYT